MPFKSKAQSDKCFATGGFGGAVDCEEWASQTDYKKLPERLNPPRKKKKSFKEWFELREKN